MPPLRIHPLSPKDWERFRTIRLEALAETPDAFGSTLERERAFEKDDWRGRLLREGTITFVASRGAATVDLGLAVGAPYDDDVGLYAMWVRPSARGTGVGTALVRSVIDWARDRGHRRLLLDVADVNSAAIALYASLGFQPTGVQDTLPPPRNHITEHQRALVL